MTDTQPTDNRKLIDELISTLAKQALGAARSFDGAKNALHYTEALAVAIRAKADL